MKYKVTLNKKTYEIEVEAGEAILMDEYEAYAPATAAPTAVPVPAIAPATPAPVAVPAPAPTAAGESVNAPMPGTVLRVEVTQGASVKAGQLLVVLEAMKMENEILSPRDGTVAQIVAQKGSSVDTGSPLLILA